MGTRPSRRSSLRNSVLKESKSALITNNVIKESSFFIEEEHVYIAQGVKERKALVLKQTSSEPPVVV